MTGERKASWAALKPFLAGALVALAGQRMLAGRRRPPPAAAPPLETGRGAAGTPACEAALAEGYEVTDADGRTIALTIGIFATAAGLVIGGSATALHVFGGPQMRTTPFTAEQRHHIAPPEPHLQADPVGDLARFEAQQNTETARYTRRADGLATIPIGRAMVLLQGKSLDSTAQIGQ